MTVEQLKFTLSSREYEQWIAYYEAEPFGHHMDNARSGIIASTLANIHRSEKNNKTYSWQDFFPHSKVKKTWQDFLAIFKAHGK